MPDDLGRWEPAGVRVRAVVALGVPTEGLVYLAQRAADLVAHLLEGRLVHLQAAVDQEGADRTVVAARDHHPRVDRPVAELGDLELFRVMTCH
ncbi:hypothetical protein [Chthonobacter rhizosphaerae]|uniref:hypothetical protein n=1 Tax=Chthonobacter rhizosphaerae TaxID=2735553 RepID=UPI0015EED6C6|nr:hypothetical protein [Chthonobacter rhizosphaerae]